MDDQRLEEIARKHFGESDCFDHERWLVKNAIREALASQEEELVRLREELRSMLRERRAAETASCQGYEATVARAEAAEAEVRSLREERDAAVDRASLAEIERDGTEGERDYYKELAERVGRLADESVTRALKRAESAEAELAKCSELFGPLPSDPDDGVSQWTDLGWTRNQLMIANQAVLAADAELQRLRESSKRLVDVLENLEVLTDPQSHVAALRPSEYQKLFDSGVIEDVQRLLASSVEEKSTNASDVLGTMDSEGPFVEPPGRPTSC